MVLAMLRELAARLRCCVPDIDDDPAWTLHLPVSADREGADQALTTLADGRFGSRGLREEDQSPHPAVLIAGVYVGQAAGQRLMEGPSWVGLRGITGPAHSDERVLDLRTGVLARRRHDATGEFRSLRAIAVNHPGMMALRAQADTRLSGAPLHLPAGTAGHRGRADGRAWVRVLAEPAGGVSAAATQWSRRNDGRVFLERRVAVAADPRRAPSAGDAIERLEGSAHVPLTALLAEQRAAWATRWADGDVLIPDDPQLQLAARFALFHLQSSVAGRGEAAVGARGLAGAGYLGHVFWDADVFVLPVLTAIRPAGARSMLEYRLRRLDAARVFAAASGRRGARFPWESARDGEDVTPRVGLADGREVPIRTGEAEEHIVADVAWAAWHYAMWSGDERFLTGDGFPLLIESARYWTSRVRVDTDGRAHIDAVIGPDEYHGPVNDNTYTNVMARWNLRRAADLARGHAVGIEAGEAETWLTIADTLVDGYDPRTGIYEQFAGYHRLEPLLPTALARVPMAADLLLGAQRLATTQIIKQADVLMAHHLVPAEMRAGSLAANLDFYGARTAHGSSLSPAVHAALLARSGAPDEALYWLRLAARLDLDDLTGATASGLHMATLGGVWQALAWGFAGVHADQGALRIDPHLPDAWSSLTLRLRFRGRKVTLTVGHDEVRVDSDAPIQVALGDRAAVSTAHIVLRADGEYPASLSRPLS